MKIVISGLGAISAVGKTISDVAETFQKGVRRAKPVTLFETDLDAPVFEVPELSFQKFPDQMRTLNLCLCAVEEAVQDSGLRDSLKGMRVGVCLGTTIGSLLSDTEFYRAFRNSGKAPMAAVDRYLQGNLAGAIASYYGVTGPSLTVVNACTSGVDAIGVGMSWIRAGICDVAIAGGADEMNRIPLCGFHALGILSDSLCAPFDRDRKGLNLGEAAGVFVLESEAHQKKRGKKVKFSVAGFGAANDAYHLTAPSPTGEGLDKAITKALEEAGIGSKDIAFVNAHGTATQENDLVESKVLSRFFGEGIPFYSTKGLTGHTLGAAGALEAAFSVIGLDEGWIPASVGFKNQDEAIPFSPVTEKTQIEGRYGLSTSLGFGGGNAAIVIERLNGSQTDG